MNRIAMRLATLRGAGKPTTATKAKPAAAATKPRRQLTAQKRTDHSFAHLAGLTMAERPVSDRAIQRGWDKAFARAAQSRPAAGPASWDAAFSRAAGRTNR